MAIVTSQIDIAANSSRVLAYTASAPGWVTVASDGSSVFLGNNTLTLANGFKMGQATVTLKVDGGDEIWAMSTSNTKLYIIGQPD